MPFVRKLRVPVRISQPNQDPLDGLLLLLEGTEEQGRPETILELLNSPRSVLPFIHGVDSEVLLLTRANIAWVAVGPGVDPHLVLPPDHTVTRQQRVQLRFTDGSHIDGVIEWNASGEHLRLSDYLNGSEESFPVTPSFGTLIVNRQRVRETLLAEASPRPAHVVEAVA